MQTNNRQGVDNELFGMYLDKMLPYAEAWYKQNGGKKRGYDVMRPFESMDNVGDFYQDPTTGAERTAPPRGRAGHRLRLPHLFWP